MFTYSCYKCHKSFSSSFERFQAFTPCDCGGTLELSGNPSEDTPPRIPSPQENYLQCIALSMSQLVRIHYFGKGSVKAEEVYRATRLANNEAPDEKG